MTDALEAARDGLRSDDPEVRRRAIVDMPGGWVPGALEILVSALSDDDWRVRKEAVARVSRWPDVAGAVDALIAVIREHDDVGWRNAALDALAHIGKPAVGPLLSEVSGGGDHRKFLVDTLGAIGESEAVPLLVRLVSDEDPNLRVAAAEALRHIGGADAKSALRACLGSADLALRLAALEGLAILQAAVSVGEVRPSLEDSVLRKSALRLLGWSRDPSAVPHLVDALRQPRRAVHAAATQALATLLATTDGDDRIEIERLTGALGDDARRSALAVFASTDSELRRSAATLLGAAGAVEFAEALAEGMADPSVAEACARALSELGTGAVAPILDAAAAAEPELRADLYDLLGNLGHGNGVEGVLIDALDDDEVVAASAARSLGALGTAVSCGPLGDALADADRPDVATSAATALGRLAARDIDPGAAIGCLASDGLRSPVAEVRSAAALALAAAGARDRLDAVAGQLTDADPYARLAAIRALADLGADGRARLRARLDDEDDAEMTEAIRAALVESDNGG